MISGPCVDSEDLLGIRKSKCELKIKYYIPDANNKTYSKETTIIIKDKNKIRENSGNKIIKINVHQDDHLKVKVQRDYARDNMNLIFALAILTFLAVGCRYLIKNNLFLPK